MSRPLTIGPWAARAALTEQTLSDRSLRCVRIGVKWRMSYNAQCMIAGFIAKNYCIVTGFFTLWRSSHPHKIVSVFTPLPSFGCGGINEAAH